MANTRALVVAINDYPGTKNDLPSCLADAARFIDVLKSDPYNYQEIRTHYDGEATLKNVTAGLDWLLEGIGPSRNKAKPERRVFYFSGHGFRTEKDGALRECLCLHDQFFFDTEFSARTQKLPPGVLTVILDSCHSGGMEKPFMIVVGSEGPEEPTERARNKVWLPDDDDFSRANQVNLPLKVFGAELEPPPDASQHQKMALATMDKSGSPQVNGLILTACRADQTAAASTSKTDGMSAFTFCLARALKRVGDTLPRHEMLSSRALLDAAALELQALNFKQTPEVKEPPNPPGLGSQAFILLRPVSSPAPEKPEAPPRPDANFDFDFADPDRWLRAILAGTAPTHSTQSKTPSTNGDRPMPEMLTNGYTETISAELPEAEEKFFGAVLRAAVRLAPTVVNIVQSLRKDFEPTKAPEDPQAEEKLWGAVLSAVMAIAPRIPGIIRSLRKDFQTEESPEVEEKFFRSVLRAAVRIAPTVASVIQSLSKDFELGTPEAEEKAFGESTEAMTMLAPVTADIMQELRKDYEPGETPEAEEKFFGAILQAAVRLAPSVVNIVRALRKDYQTEETPETEKGFFDSLVRTVTRLAPVVTGIIQGLRKDYQLDKAPEDPEAEEKFFGSVLRAAVRLAPTVMGIIQTFRKEYDAGEIDKAFLVGRLDGRGLVRIPPVRLPRTIRAEAALSRS